MLDRALRLIRVYHDMNQTEVSLRTGLSKSYISEIESGKKKASLTILDKYSKAFDLPVSSILFFAEENEERRVGERSRHYIADKALKMLEWIEMLSFNR